MSTEILRAAGLFQTLITAPIVFALGGCVFFDLFDNYQTVYQFLYCPPPPPRPLPFPCSHNHEPSTA